MNTENNNTPAPPPPPAPTASSAPKDERAFHLAADGVQQGPYSLATLKQMQAEGSIVAGTVYWTQGMTEWKPVTELLDPPIAAPTPAQTASLNAPAAQEGKGGSNDITLKAMNALKENCIRLNAKGIQFSAAKMLAGLLIGVACGLLVGIISVVGFRDEMDGYRYIPDYVVILVNFAGIVMTSLIYSIGGAVVSLFPMTEKPKRRASGIAAITGGALGSLFALLVFSFSEEAFDLGMVFVVAFSGAIMLAPSGLPLGYVLHKVETKSASPEA